ncbi:hypothetical protein [Rhodococcus chondri]|uniref:DUF4062 domain-containing protein n=1 Tax=Rhodococcus chondri TaxID=3065941 RepID=A0ABU7JUW1_9NOCA|nr:hypothetical protein [Rhodococcus sp. CC-R104]MEE2033640.1 hypothetical protein [Rhodococcus sp. CC-R104]
MGFDAHVLKVMISTPGDTTDEVEAVSKALHGWNGSRAEGAQTVLLPRFWKADAVPTLNASGGQSVINSQLVDDADIVVALFDSRLGQATDNAVSGTAEEIERAAEGGKPVHVYFSDEPIDRKNADYAELGRLQKFREELQGKGLLGVYADLNDLAYKVRDAIESDVNGLGLGAPSVVRKGEHALPRLSVVRETNAKGTTDDYVVIENKSTAITAEELRIDLQEWQNSVFRQNDDPFSLPPLHKIRWPAAFSMGDATQINATLTWTEPSGPQSVELPVTYS